MLKTIIYGFAEEEYCSFRKLEDNCGVNIRYMYPVSYTHLALRFFLLSTHYRSPLDFSDDRLEEAEKNMDKLKDVIARIKEMASMEGS